MHAVLVLSLRRWLPFAVAITGLCGLVFLEMQQVIRQSANDPQIQMAEDAAARLAAGAAADATVPRATVDIASSLAPFVIVYDAQDRVIASSATLDGATPRLPEGVLAAARQSGEDRVTWEPRAGVRIAAVVVPYHGGAVLAGRSLREVERREVQRSRHDCHRLGIRARCRRSDHHRGRVDASTRRGHPARLGVGGMLQGM